MQKTSETRLTLAYVALLAVLVVVYKLIPRYLNVGEIGWNLVSVGALGLFIGSRVRTSWAYFVPIGAMFVADLLLIPPLRALGYSSIDSSTPFTYLGFALYVVAGRLVGQKELAPAKIAGSSVLGSLLFFVVSNFGSWVANPAYPRSLAGLIQCYLAGVPFYFNTLMSDLIFPAVFFGCHALLLRTVSTTEEVEQLS